LDKTKAKLRVLKSQLAMQRETAGKSGKLVAIGEAANPPSEGTAGDNADGLNRLKELSVSGGK
jgi:hypothetical protein